MNELGREINRDFVTIATSAGCGAAAARRASFGAPQLVRLGKQFKIQQDYLEPA